MEQFLARVIGLLSLWKMIGAHLDVLFLKKSYLVTNTDHLGNTRVVHSAVWDGSLNNGTGALNETVKGAYDYYPYGKPYGSLDQN